MVRDRTSFSHLREAGVKMEAYFRLPDGKQSFSPFDGECKEMIFFWITVDVNGCSGICSEINHP